MESFFGFGKSKKSEKASRLHMTPEMSTNKQYSGNISIINVDVEIANKTFSIIPKQGGTLSDLRTEVMARFENHFKITLDPKFREAFYFFVKKSEIPQTKETMNLEKLLQEEYPKNKESFHGDIVTVILKIKDTLIEYELLKQLLSRFFLQATVAVYRIRQIHKTKNTLRNRVIKLEHSHEFYTINICNVRGDIKDTFILRNLTLTNEGKTSVEGGDYYLVRLQPRNAGDGKSSQIEDLYFSSEEEVLNFFNSVHEFQHIEEDFDHDEDEEESVSISGSDSPTKSESELSLSMSQKRSSLRFMRTESLPEVDLKSIGELGDSPNMQQSKISLIRDFQLRRNNSLCKTETEIQKALRDRQMLKLESFEWVVKTSGSFGIKQQRILRINEDFEFIFFKKEKEGESDVESYTYVSHFPMSDVLKIKPRSEKNIKIEVIFKNEKKYPKPMKIDFEDEKDGDRFMELIKSIVKLFAQSRNSFRTEKEQKDNDKAHSWLIGPKSDQLSVEFDQGEMQAIQFKIVNTTNFAEAQIAHISLKNSLLTLKPTDGSNEKKIGLQDIHYCETDMADPRGLNLLFKNRKVSLLFCDNRSRLLFEAAIHEAIMPEYKLSPKKPFEPAKLKVFATTFNAGNALPSKDLDLWLGKSKENDIIAIAMQECETAGWLESIQTYYGGENFTLVTLVTMWRMLLIVFVKNDFVPYVNSVISGYKPTGIADLLGNKGGVAIAFKVLETSFCFMGCHLAASPEKMTLRKSNFYNLMKYLRLLDDKVEMPAAFDYFFFLGDANFRLDCDFYFALNAVNSGEHEGLLFYDQLLKAQKNDNFMTTFSEGKITFKPTYRRNREDTGYSNKRNQSPSWTDRILVKSRPGSEAEILAYDSEEMFFLSDHRPSFSVFRCKIVPPYLPERPLYLRDPNYVGVLKFASLSMTYDYQQHEQMSEVEEPFVWPLNIIIYFRAKFLSKVAMTLPLELKNSTGVVSWEQKLIPFLYCIIPDSKYLKSSNILGIIKAKRDDEIETVMGQADISLNTLMENQGAKTEFNAQIYLYGRIFGTLKGVFLFERP